MRRISLCLTLAALLIACATPAQAADKSPVENVLIITYDGLRWQEVFGGVEELFLAPALKVTKNIAGMRRKYFAETPEERREKLMPFFWGTIAKEGQIFGHAESNSLSRVTNGKNFSYPGYSEILVGAPDDRIDSNAKTNNPNVTVLEWLNNKPAYKGKVAAFTSWDVFPFIINAERSGIPVNSGWVPYEVTTDRKRRDAFNEIAVDVPHVWDGVRYDVFTYHAAIDYIQKKKPRVLYISFGETDDWAHMNNYDQYLDSAYRTDQFIQRIWEKIQSMSQYKGKTALILSTDHGRGDKPETWNGHGEKQPETDRIWIAAMGPGIPAKGIVKDVPTTQSQIASTAAALLGLEYRADSPLAGAPIPLN
ncbi:MAG TPA: sulfatase-like hydrolase/transferase [Candidatus Hydrogenedentes bacterium]|nr:sulfatase-like hydrolase/transferase [Candidatus Hydrogenedentota bacterium]